MMPALQSAAQSARIPLLLAALVVLVAGSTPAFSQPPTNPADAAASEEPGAEPAGAEPSDELPTDAAGAAASELAADEDAAAASEDAGTAGEGALALPARAKSLLPTLWDLAIQGGWFMIPIALASVITIAFTLERLVGLRRGRNLPRRLIRRIREIMADPVVDPRLLWQAAEKHRSPLANVLKVAVLKTGRPHAEVEKAVEDAVQRETDDMTRNLRPINVVASISPLLGLLGTVQGMILAFMVTSTTTSTGTAKAQELAHGIYTALVTTFAGLTVAVISVILANFLEGRIDRTLKFMEAIFLDLLPGLERYEGRVRISESSVDNEGIRIRQIAPAEKPPAGRSPAEPAAAAGTATTRTRPLKTPGSGRAPQPTTSDS